MYKKTILLSVVILFVIPHYKASAQSPTKDTIPCYYYLDMYDNWKLRLVPNDSFELVVNSFSFPMGNMLTGKYFTSNDSIRFVPDSSSAPVVKAIEESKMMGTPVKNLAKGVALLKMGDYIVPEKSDTGLTVSVTGKYYHGDDEGREQIELFKNGTFILTEFSCKSKFVSKGKYILNGNFISFHTYKKSPDLLRRITQNNTAFIKNNYLICRSFQPRTVWDENVTKYTVDNEFSYFIKTAQ
jgi:hypothetical protein